MEAWGPLAGLFASAFVSSTILPGNSEIALAALLAWRPDLVGVALAVATAGNTAGGMTSYALGRLLPDRATARVPPRILEAARRWGVAALLFSWVPVVGDALCVASGWLRQDWRLALVAIAAGKFARYAAIAMAIDRWAG